MAAPYPPWPMGVAGEPWSLAGAAPPVTVALSGGGAKCAAQAGALAVLAGAGVEVGALVGVSGGGLVAVLHALGWQPEAICDFIADTHLLQLWDFDPGRRALIGVGRCRVHLASAVGDRTFGDLATPVVVVAVDLETGQEVYLSSGRLVDALVATMAIPGLIAPICHEGRQLVDGGLLNPLPVDVARQWGQPVVAIDVLSQPSAHSARPQLFEAQGALGYVAGLSQHLGLIGVLEVVNQAVQITTGRIRDHNLRAFPPEILIQPEVEQVGLFAFDLAEHAFCQGQAAARQALPQLTQFMPPHVFSR